MAGIPLHLQRAAVRWAFAQQAAEAERNGEAELEPGTTAGGDRARMRGVPILGAGHGAIRGTTPHLDALAGHGSDENRRPHIR